MSLGAKEILDVYDSDAWNGILGSLGDECWEMEVWFVGQGCSVYS